MTRRTAVVVGAGVIGSGIAFELARRGTEVTVVDAAHGPGQGSTSASSAIVRYHYRHYPEAALAWEAGHRWQRWSEYLGAHDPLGMATFIQSGLLLLDGELIDLADALTHLSRLGVIVERLSADEIRAKFPALEPGRFGPPALPADDRFWEQPRGDLTAYWIPQSGYVDDPALAAHNLAHAAQQHGAIFRFSRRVTAVTKYSDRVTGVILDDGSSLTSDVVINAAGPWSAQLNDLAGVLGDFAMSTRPLQQEIVSLPKPDGYGRPGVGPCVTDVDLGTYFRPHSGATMIVGGIEAPCDPLVWLDRPEDAQLTVGHDTWNTQTLRVSRRIPAAGVPNRPRGIVGVYDVTDDWIPIYDRTNLPGFYVAIGTSGHGFKQAPVVGELVAHLIDACEDGHPHDDTPIHVRLSLTGANINLGHFSRLRTVEAQNAMG